MKSVSSAGSLIIAFAAALLLAPISLSADDGQPASGKRASSAPPRVLDVVLDSEGVLKGVVVDGQGHVVSDETLVLKQGRREVGRARTSQDGVFQVTGLRSGVYQMSTPQGESVYRVWTAETAPKSARQLALVVNETRQVRGQFENTLLTTTETTSLLTLGVAGTLGGISLSEINTLQKQVDALLATIN